SRAFRTASSSTACGRWRGASRRSASTCPGAPPGLSRSSSRSAGSRCGTATTTHSRRCATSGSTTVQCAPGSSTTTPPPRWIGCSLHSPRSSDHVGRKDYSGTPLSQKLGAKPGAGVVVFFTTSRGQLERRFSQLHATLDSADGLWIAWPKKTANIATDLDFGAVQRTGLDAGLVDNKSCAIDES